MNAQCLQKPGEDNGSPGTGAVHCCKMLQDPSSAKLYFCYVVIMVLTVAVVALSVAFSVRTTEQISSKINTCAASPNNWTLFEKKCFYFSENSSDWTSCQNFCREQGAQLARFDNPEELKFLMRYKGDFNYWIGLHRESSAHPWRWPDNTEYNNTFPIRGDGIHGFLSDNGISSSRDYIKRKCICSKSIDTLQSQ
ncbi:C-type lectin domain family 2 member G-like [Apodemus sylvaticus]|uniref:C-type lectin domain family 2 member G-like n=1 Tax=Apodemus sylvaticus TaxID=10129 RepID=UPI0022444AE3|nr:C-type lectin domain family 2 member G-like [Apodemus sylvaticus]